MSFNDKKNSIEITIEDVKSGLVLDISKIIRLDYIVTDFTLPTFSLIYPLYSDKVDNNSYYFKQFIKIDKEYRLRISFSDLAGEKGGLFVANTISVHNSTDGNVVVNFISSDKSRSKKIEAGVFKLDGDNIKSNRLNFKAKTYKDVIINTLNYIKGENLNADDYPNVNIEGLLEGEIITNSSDTCLQFLSKLAISLDAIFIYSDGNSYFKKIDDSNISSIKASRNIEGLISSLHKENYYKTYNYRAISTNSSGIIDDSKNYIVYNRVDFSDIYKSFSSLNGFIEDISYEEPSKEYMSSVSFYNNDEANRSAHAFFNIQNSSIFFGSFVDYTNTNYSIDKLIELNGYKYKPTQILYRFKGGNVKCRVNFTYFPK